MNQNSRTKNLLLNLIGVILLLFVALSLVSYFRKQSVNNNGSDRISLLKNQKALPSDVNKADTFPRISVGSWNFIGPAIMSGTHPSKATIYGLKHDLGKADFVELASKLGLGGVPPEEGGARIKGAKRTGTDSAVLYFEKKSGSFLFKSTSGLPLVPSKNTQLEPQKAQEFVTGLIGDPSIRITATYQKKSTPGVVYYELHRDWEKAGLPIVNVMGLFNLPLNYKLTSLNASSLYPDDSIFSTSDNTDGKSRLNDFNSLTVGLKNGNVMTLISKLRLLSPPNNKVSVISYLDAVKKLRANHYESIFTSPTGAGNLNHSQIYKDNKGEIKSVTITESMLAYVEDLPYSNQSHLVPYYIFRGSGVLDSGYRTDVIVSVPASQSKASGPLTGKSKASSAQPSSGTCHTEPSADELSNLQTDGSGAVYGQTQGTQDAKQWFVVPYNNIDVNLLNDALDSSHEIITATDTYEVTGTYKCALIIM